LLGRAALVKLDLTEGGQRRPGVAVGAERAAVQHDDLHRASRQAPGVYLNLRGRPKGSHSTTYRSPLEATVSACGVANLSGWPSISFGLMPWPSPRRATALSSASRIVTRAPSSGT